MYFFDYFKYDFVVIIKFLLQGKNFYKEREKWKNNFIALN